MKISGVKTFLVGNPWKNWLFVRVDTDEGLYGVGEGTLNAFSATVEAAIHELEDAYIGQDPTDIELIMQRMTRDMYSEGGQIHGSAVAAIEVACWDILGKSVGRPIHQLMGGQLRSRTRAYANGWYRTDRTPEAFAEKAKLVVERGYTAMKFDPFGAGWRMQERREEDLSVDIVAAVRDLPTGHGYDALNDEYGDMFDKGIVDAAKVTRSALQHAASIAGMVLTTETLVTDLPEEERPAAAAGHSHDY